MVFVIFHVPIEVRRAAYLRLAQLAAHGGPAVDPEAVPPAETAPARGRRHRAPGAELVITP